MACLWTAWQARGVWAQIRVEELELELALELGLVLVLELALELELVSTTTHMVQTRWSVVSRELDGMM